ncbi:MAG: hypothetical protein IKB25_08325 [Lentisphaeria bacterium]|nr:hypothetical protein [Lentisphaeria bacterium]
MKNIMKNLCNICITAFSALRAGKVFAADNISVIASCRKDADIIAGALKVLKAHTGNAEHYNSVHRRFVPELSRK